MDNQRLKRSQYMLLLAGFIHGAHMQFGFIEKMAGHDNWLVLFAGSLISLPVLLVITLLSKKHPGKDLVQILEAVFGRVIGKTVAALYFFYFFILLAFNLWDISTFYIGSFMPETPYIVFIVVTASVCAYAVKKGMGSVARICLLTISFGIFVPVVTSLLLLGDMDFTNFLPVLEKPAQSYVRSVVTYMTTPFGQAVALLFVLPSVTEKKRLNGYTAGAVTIVTLIFLVVGIRNTAVLGASAEVFPRLAFETVRMINIGEFLTRVEIVIALVLTTASFVKISVLYFACVKSASTLLSLKSYNSIILPVGGIAVAVAIVIFSSTVYNADWAEKYSAMFSLPFAVVIPLITLAVSLLRQKKQKRTPVTYDSQRDTMT